MNTATCSKQICVRICRRDVQKALQVLQLPRQLQHATHPKHVQINSKPDNISSQRVNHAGSVAYLMRSVNLTVAAEWITMFTLRNRVSVKHAHPQYCNVLVDQVLVVFVTNAQVLLRQLTRYTHNLLLEAGVGRSQPVKHLHMAITHHADALQRRDKRSC